jgi:hypothetical protein
LQIVAAEFLTVGLPAPPSRKASVKLRGVNEKLRDVSEPLAQLAEPAADSGPWHQVPDADLVGLTAAARAAGHRWDAIEAACDNGPRKDIPAVIGQQYWLTPLAGPGLFAAAQRAARTL